MFDLVQRNKRISQVILAIIIIPFAFFGMDAYFSDGPGGRDVARIGDISISTVEFDRELTNRQDEMRRSSEGQVDNSLFATREFRAAVLENMINDRVLAMYALDNRLAVPSQQLQSMIAAEEAFHVDGRFARDRYEMILASQGMSPQMFERGVAQDLRTQQIVQAFGQSAFAGKTSVQQLVDIQLEERTVSGLLFPLDRFEGKVEIAPEAAEAYYKENQSDFLRPARLQAEYVVFNRAALSEGVEISEDVARAYYDANQERFGLPEERSARHILIRVAASASDEEVAAAEEKAQKIVEELRANPASFAEVAKRDSQDPGSASAGGDLGTFGPGVMVPPFEEAVFGGKVGEISDVVRTDFGFHIIEVTGITPTTVQPFEEVRDEIVQEMAEQEASRRYPLLAEQFANTVYEQPDSLAPAAEALGLEVQRSDWISREQAELGGFSDPRLTSALFSREARELGENIEAIEVERGTMVAARVAEYEDAKQLSFEEVRERIEERLRREEAGRLAREEGDAALATLREGGEVSGDWSDSFTEMRGSPSLPPEAARAVFSVAEDDVPGYVASTLPDGAYAVFHVEGIDRIEVGDDAPEVRMLGMQYDRLVAEQEFTAFVLALREMYGVEINASALSPDED